MEVLPLRQRRRRLAWSVVLSLSLALALLLGSAGPLRAGGASPEAPQGAPDDAPIEAGSFHLAPVRILGIPMFSVASPALTTGARGNTDAAVRARVIEGNLALLYEPLLLCSPGESLAVKFMQGFFLNDGEDPCSDQRLGLRGRPEALSVETRPQAGGGVLLQARLPGRESTLPLLTVTDADARLNGTTAAALARRWRALLERNLRSARRMLTPSEIWWRWRRVALIELGLAGLLVVVLALWRRSRRHLRRSVAAPSSAAVDHRDWRRALAAGPSLLLLATALAVLVTMAGVATFAVPGQMPLALDLLLLPLGVLLKLALLGLLVALLRVLSRLLFSQWAARADLPQEFLARRDQRQHSLELMSRRLIHLTAFGLAVLWVGSGIPGVRQLSASALLASGALLGALAIVFQGLLRDFAAGLVVLFDDRYAIGDVVDLGGLSGEVVDLGLLSTELRGADQRVVTVPNSRCEPVVNHTKLRSGAELKLPLAPVGLDLPRALEVVRQEAAEFAADPAWQPLLLQPPQVRGVSEVTPEGVWLSVLLATAAGRQGVAQRALLARLVERLGREGIALASAAG